MDQIIARQLSLLLSKFIGKVDRLQKRLTEKSASFFIEDYGNYKLNGKTGLSVRNGNYNGWFVGYIESKESNYFFATNIEPKDQLNDNSFTQKRKKITIEALNTLQ